jgi:hypothetical protein
MDSLVQEEKFIKAYGKEKDMRTSTVQVTRLQFYTLKTNLISQKKSSKPWMTNTKHLLQEKQKLKNNFYIKKLFRLSLDWSIFLKLFTSSVRFARVPLSAVNVVHWNQ